MFEIDNLHIQFSKLRKIIMEQFKAEEIYDKNKRRYLNLRIRCLEEQFQGKSKRFSLQKES